MDRDPSENVIDSQDRATPSTGASDYGESGAERARAAEDKEPDRKTRAPQNPPSPD
jgi:hypothetical protein